MLLIVGTTGKRNAKRIDINAGMYARYEAMTFLHWHQIILCKCQWVSDLK
jgi:hypothetical protein